MQCLDCYPRHCTPPAAAQQVGLIETREQAERKSGAEAWSLRVHSSLLELPFTELLARYGDDAEAVPYHRIAWFKRGGVVVWCVVQQRPQHSSPSCTPHCFKKL